MPGVIPALLELQRAGFELVMVTNQDGLGTPSMPEADFRASHDFLLELFESQGVHFSQVFICPHFATDGCECRKPKLGLLTDWLATHPLDRAASVVIGDRDTDLEFARNLGIAGYACDATGRRKSPGQRLHGVSRGLNGGRRSPGAPAKPSECDGRSRPGRADRDSQRHWLLRSHARADRTSMAASPCN